MQMQSAEVVLGVFRERGRKGLPCEELYRQMFNKDLYLLAISSPDSGATAGARRPRKRMSEEKINDQSSDAVSSTTCSPRPAALTSKEKSENFAPARPAVMVR